jgi:pheromone shutdown protein TraB
VAAPAETHGVGESAKHVAEHASALARLEVELALTELKRKTRAIGIGISLLVGAVIVTLYVVGFGLATVAAALMLVVDPWLALLIVTGALLLLTAALAGIGVMLVKRGTPPMPEQAIAEAKLTTERLRSNGSR